VDDRLAAAQDRAPLGSALDPLDLPPFAVLAEQAKSATLSRPGRGLVVPISAVRVGPRFAPGVVALGQVFTFGPELGVRRLIVVPPTG